MNNLEGAPINKTKSREEINTLVEELNQKYPEAKLNPSIVESDMLGHLIVGGGKPMTEKEFQKHVKELHEVYAPSDKEHWYDK